MIGCSLTYLKNQHEAEINNSRTFKGKEDSSKGQSISTVSTLVVQNKKNPSYYENLLVV